MKTVNFWKFVCGRRGQSFWSLISLTVKIFLFLLPFYICWQNQWILQLIFSHISLPLFHACVLLEAILTFLTCSWVDWWLCHLRRARERWRWRKGGESLQCSSNINHVTTFTNPCNKFEKSFANLTKHTSTRQWSKKGEGREKVERFYSSDCNVQCFSNKIFLRWIRGVFKGRQRDWAKVYRVRVSQKTDFQNAAGATVHPLNHQ